MMMMNPRAGNKSSSGEKNEREGVLLFCGPKRHSLTQLPPQNSFLCGRKTTVFFGKYLAELLFDTHFLTQIYLLP